MDACLRPPISYPSYYDNHQVEKERYWKNRKKIEKYCQKNVRIVYNSFCVLEELYLRIIVCGRITDF